jgi:hypothetical protein
VIACGMTNRTALGYLSLAILAGILIRVLL